MSMDSPRRKGPTGLRLCRRWLDWLAARIPDHRAERFRKEWEAELTIGWRRLCASPPKERETMGLYLRMFGAWRDAWYLRRTAEPERPDRIGTLMEEMLQDVRFALRGLRRSPGFTAVALLTLALGLGASTAIYSLVRGIVWQPLPYPQPERILAFEPGFSFSKRDLRQLQAELSSFQVIAGWSESGQKLLEADGAEFVDGPEVSGEVFEVLGISPLHGRLLRVGDDLAGGDGVVISAAFARQRFGDPEAAVGRRLRFSAGDRVVLGVLPEGIPMLQRGARVVTPLLMEQDVHWTGGYLSLLGRLRPGISLQAARAELDVLLDRWRQERGKPDDWGRGVALVPMQEHLVGAIRPRMLLLMGAVLLTLTIAMVNVAHLLLARSLERRAEISLRSALGASAGRMVRLLLTEATVLALLGGVLGYGLAIFGLRGLVALLPADTPRIGEVDVDLATLGFALGISLLTGWLMGVVPALRGARSDLRGSVGDGGRTGTGSGRKRLRGVLVVAEVALAVALLCGAGALMSSFEKLRSVSPGLDPSGLLTATIGPEAGGFESPEALDRYYDELTARLRALPGVESVATVHAVPIHNTGWRMGIYRADRPAPTDRSAPPALWRPVSPEWFRTGRVELVAGRAFERRDRADSVPVAILNESAARELFPEGEAVGKSFFMSWVSPEPLRVVGVVENVKAVGLDQAPPRIVYRPFRQSSEKLLTIGNVQRSVALRAEGDLAVLAPALRHTVRVHDPNAAVLFLGSMSSVIAESVAGERAVGLLLALFAGSALLLGAIGLYGVLEHAVREERRELSIRLALGASSRELFLGVLRRGLGLGLVGTAFGLILATAMAGTLEALVFEVEPAAPGLLAAAAGILLLVAILAATIPAWHASNSDPIAALRSE